MKKSTATKPLVSGKQYHIDMKKGDISRFVLTPGDPARVAKIASFWGKSREVAHHREYRTFRGIYKGTDISCMSTGIGSPAMGIAVEELVEVGVDTIIRVGTTGGIQKGQRLGDIVISTAAVRLDGASHDFVMPEYPAVANYEVVLALIQAVEEFGFRYHVGITASCDSFYTGQGRPSLGKYLPSFKENIYRDLQAARVQNIEMEASCLFTLASIFGKRAGAVCTIIANRVTDEFKVTDEFQKRAGLVASHAVYILNKWDKEKKKKKKKYFYPELIK